MNNKQKSTSADHLDKNLLNQITAKPADKQHSSLGWKTFALALLLAFGLIFVFYALNKLIFSVNSSNSIKSEKTYTAELVTTDIEINDLSVFQGDVILEVSGYAVAVNKSSVSSDITGRIKKIFLEIGDQVKRDDIIALLDDEEALINFADKKLNLTNSQLELERAILEYEDRSQKLDRLKELVQSNSISKETLENAEKEFKEASIRKRIVKVNLDLSKNELKSAQIFLDKHTIRVPFDGVVVDVFAREGEAISPSSSGNSSIRTGLIQLIDPTELYIEVEVPEQFITKISDRHDVLISIPNQDLKEIQDQVKWIAPVSSRQRGVIEVGINLPEGIDNIVDGMELNVRFVDLSKNIVRINN